MNVLISLTYYTPYLSGLTVYARSIAEGLAHKGHRVTVLSMQNTKNLPNRETLNGVYIVRANPFLQISKGFLSFDWIIQSLRLTQKNDVFIIHLPQFEGWIVACFAWMMNKRVISVYHCEVVLPKGLINSIIQYLLESVNRISLLLSSRIVTSSQDFAEHSRLLKPFLRKVIPLYPPIVVGKPPERIKKSIENKVNKKNTILIGFIGRIAAEKGIEYLIQSIPLILRNMPTQKKSIKLVIAGPDDVVGEDAYKKTIKSLFNTYKDHIILLGQLSDDELAALYALLDVLVVPSVNSTEAFGMVQAEAMLSGVPVIASDLPGIRVPVRVTGMGIIVHPRDSNAIAEAIIRIVQQKRQFLGHSSGIFFKQISEENVITSYERLLWSH